MYSTVAHLRSSAVKERKETRWKAGFQVGVLPRRAV